MALHLFIVLSDNRRGGDWSNWPLRGAKGGSGRAACARGSCNRTVGPHQCQRVVVQRVVSCLRLDAAILRPGYLIWWRRMSMARHQRVATPPRDEVIIHVDTSSYGMTGP